MNAEIDEYYLEALRRYYSESGDKGSKIVDFSSGLTSPFLNASEVIGENNDFSIIDPFDGVRPVVLNHRFLVDGHEETAFISGIALDSQVAFYIHQYVTDEAGAFKATPRGLATRSLLMILSQYSVKGWDINPFFYLMESLSKGMFENVFPHARSVTESMLKVQTMDSAYFIQHCRIVPHPEKLQEYMRRHGSAPFQTASAKLVNHMADFRSMQLHIEAIYATLLKIGLLAQEKSSAEDKFARLMDFFINELGVFLMREAVLSCLHFKAKSGNLIPLQRGAKAVKKKLLASAWDLFLLRLPETIINNEGNDYTSIYYVCTADKALQRLGRMFVIRRVSSLKAGRGHVPSSVGVRADLLADEVGEELTAVFYARCQRSLTGRLSATPRNPEDVLALVRSLEQKASQIAAM